MRDNTPLNSPHENERDSTGKEPENVWPAELKLSPDLTAVFTPTLPKTRKHVVRHIAALGRFKRGEPCIQFNLAYEKRDGSYTLGHHVARFSLAEFRQLCRKLWEILRSNPELGEDRPTGRPV